MGKAKDDLKILDDCYTKHDAKTSEQKTKLNGLQCKSEHEDYMKEINGAQESQCVLDAYIQSSDALPSLTGVKAPADPVCPKMTTVGFRDKLHWYKNTSKTEKKNVVDLLKDTIQKKTKDVETYQAFLNICQKEIPTAKLDGELECHWENVWVT